MPIKFTRCPRCGLTSSAAVLTEGKCPRCARSGNRTVAMEPSLPNLFGEVRAARAARLASRGGES